MSDEQRIEKVVLAAVRDVNDVLPVNRRIQESSDAVLFGPGGLDSIGLVNLVVAVEQGLQDEFEREFVLASEKAMSQRTSPFRTVATLSHYILELLREPVQ